MSPLARPELFWSTDRVASHLAESDVRVVDCRFAFDGGGREKYLAGHLPGAVHCDWARDLSAAPPPSGHPQSMLIGPAEFADRMERWGISNDTQVIGYDDEGGHHAARLWLGLRRYSHDRFALMEGGIQKWTREGRPLQTGDVMTMVGSFVPRPRDGVIADKKEVLAAVRTGDPWLLDVRREGEYTGEEKRAARGGHIPGAVHLHWRDALTDAWMLRDPEELESLYANAGFGPETSAITYCQAGVRAAFTHLLLTALGRDDVRTYDGSWEEWGNDPSLPITVGRS